MQSKPYYIILRVTEVYTTVHGALKQSITLVLGITALCVCFVFLFFLSSVFHVSPVKSAVECPLGDHNDRVNFVKDRVHERACFSVQLGSAHFWSSKKSWNFFKIRVLQVSQKEAKLLGLLIFLSLVEHSFPFFVASWMNSWKSYERSVTGCVQCLGSCALDARFVWEMRQSPAPGTMKVHVGIVTVAITYLWAVNTFVLIRV